MAIGDKYVLTLRSFDSGLDPTAINPFFNVFAYEATSGSSSAGDCIAAFDNDIMTNILNICSIVTEFTSIECINLDNLSDFSTLPITQFGIVTGEYLSPFVGWEFQYIRAVRGVHHGRKTFGMVGEASQANGAPTGSMLITLVGTQTVLGQPINGVSGTYTPRIWRRAGSYAPYSGVPPVGTPYPDTFYPIAGVQFNRLSTQNSRKR